ncbi:MAG: hotdog fold thioesterase [Chitinophagaceae bacterium]|nr:MAG: hotdog fold thioesterase [Chitinophagaceae bacterium]
MSIWFDKNISLENLKPLGLGSMSEHVGIEWVEMGDDYLKARLPVNKNTMQPYGMLHGGASCVLAETIGSVASFLVIDNSKFLCVGIEINANHIRSAREGFVIGVAAPLHLGSSTHVWDIKIYDEKKQLVCVSRLTVAIIPRKAQ